MRSFSRSNGSPDCGVLAGALAALVLASAPLTAAGQEIYFAANPADEGELTVLGVTDGTNVEVLDLDSETTLDTEEIDRFEVLHLDLAGVHHLAVQTSHPVLAYLGHDCCGVGGTTFVPTEGGHGRVGRAFILYLPVLGTQSDLWLFAVEDATLQITTAEGAPVARRNLRAGDTWQPYPITSQRPYLLRSTGDVLIMDSAVNGFAAVPPTDRDAACDGDKGRHFYFATHGWGTGAFAIFAYEDATITLTARGEPEPRTETFHIAAGDWEFRSDAGRQPWELEATGDVALWAGDLEGGESIDDMGDDFSVNLGGHGQRIILRSQNHGATIFAAHDGTTVTIDGETSRLDAMDWLELGPRRDVSLEADHPVVVVTHGGNTLNDWGGFLRPAPLDGDATPPCPEPDAGLQPWPDAGARDELDADLDAGDGDEGGLPDGGEEDLDAALSDESFGLGPPRATCDCLVAGPARSAPRRLMRLLRP